ncbi:MAG: aminodeoxychorismate synthase component I [Candidatus Promineifilaceae bacterium]|nr:aminodeoxychorismate synthase component I [Candidatus Promineifilaceae bacterium]
MDANGLVILHDAERGHWLKFEQPVHQVAAWTHDQVETQLTRVAQAVEAERLHAAGYLSYEAAPAFDAALRVRPAHGRLPLLWFGLYRRPKIVAPPEEGDDDSSSYVLGRWRASTAWPSYRRAIERIKACIAAGDTYQVNYTIRLKGAFRGEPWSLFADMVRKQQSNYAAFISLNDLAICSASPELFFALDGNTLSTRPMKGTARRGLTLASDRAQAESLQRSVKDRAENVMIVDMIRNDLGRVSRIGSVRVPQLFTVERYPTVWQMTSTVESATDASLTEIMAALFPCASITGAPKVSTMEIIANLENEPRGVYTGAIGFIAPERRAQFNVAIRTAVIDRHRDEATYGVGGGIVWDSTAESEYQECRTKTLVLTDRRPAFRLLETILWQPEQGYRFLGRHLQRLADSASYFGYSFEEAVAKRQLTALAQDLPRKPHVVRMLLAAEGQIELQARTLARLDLAWTPDAADASGILMRVVLANRPVDSQNVFLYHKTTHRTVYEEARHARAEADEVILYNQQDEITEATTANVVIRVAGELVTPAQESGLLSGTFRAALLDSGFIREQKIFLQDLRDAEAIYLINSVRGWRRAELVRQSDSICIAEQSRAGR